MKAGVRALGIAESYRGETSSLAGAVVRASRVVEGFGFGTCTVAGSDATSAMADLVARLDRADVQYLFVSGIAPAWFNIVDLPVLHDATGLPTCSVTFEESPGLEPAIREAFDDRSAVERRLGRYRDQPERQRVSVNGDAVYVRAVGFEAIGADPGTVVQGFTPEGGRPEPLRVARLAARGVDDARDALFDGERGEGND